MGHRSAGPGPCKDDPGTIGVIHTFSRAACGWATGCHYVLILFTEKMQGPIDGCTQLFNLQLHFLRFSNAYNLKVSSFRLASGRRIGHWEAPVERLGLLFQA